MELEDNEIRLDVSKVYWRLKMKCPKENCSGELQECYPFSTTDAGTYFVCDKCNSEFDNEEFEELEELEEGGGNR